jgi:glucose-6-phosphate 1-dehydrogenase
MVIFGATGDLTSRKLIPALYYLYRDSHAPEQFAVLGVGRRPLDDDGFREHLSGSIREYLGEAYDAELWQQLMHCTHYLQGDFTEAGLYRHLDERLQQLATAKGMPENFLFYLATPQHAFAGIATGLGNSGLLQEQDGNWRRLVVEKPFGNDLQSAIVLNRHLHAVLDESQIYRIDHYLGKETVQNILAYRFANSTVEPIWNRRYIDHVQITVAESLGVEQRGGYYDSAGALRDMVPNHMLALLAVVAMEPPNSFNADDIRDEQTKVLRAIQSLDHDEVLGATVRGQYGAGVLPGGQRVPDYRAEPRVAADSSTETYAAIRLLIDSWRWAGVPFYLRTGKCLPGRYTEVVVQYRHAPNVLFRDSLVKRENVPANSLVLRIQPDEGIGMHFNAKLPGPTTRLGSVAMDFRYSDHFDTVPMTGYETLIHDCMIGDATLFKRADHIEAAWSLMDPILDVWSALPARDFPNYTAGTWGPVAADRLLQQDGRAWRPCRVCVPADR